MPGHFHNALADESTGETIKNISNEEMPIKLYLVADEIKDNYEKILTWSGEIAVKISMLHTGITAKEVFKFTDGTGEIPDSILQKVEEKINFVIDTKKNYVYIDDLREKPSKYFDYHTGVDLGNKNSSPYWSTIIARPDFLLEAKPKSYNRTERIISQRIAVKKTAIKTESRTGLYETIVSDPRRIFMPGGISTWDHNDILIKKIEQYGKVEFDGYSLKMEEHKNGDSVEYKIIEPSVISMERNSPENYIITTKIFSTQYGLNLIYWEVTSGTGRLLQAFSNEYDLINGVYLPNTTALFLLKNIVESSR
jgi:hypothetical protein